MLPAPLKLLFVCTEGRDRSLTAERLSATRPGIGARSAGTAFFARRVLKREDLEWADLVLVMRAMHRNKIQRKWPEWWAAHQDCVEVLDIPDRYKLGDPKLIGLLEHGVAVVLSKHGLVITKPPS